MVDIWVNKMGFFDDDSEFGIEDLFRQMTGGEGFSEYSSVDSKGKKTTSRRSLTDSKRIPVNQVITNKNIFFIFDFSGEKDVEAKIDDEFILNDYGKKVPTENKILLVNSVNKNLGKYTLPKRIKLKTINSTFNNGVLEVRFVR